MLLTGFSWSLAQNGVIKGRLTDEMGLAMPGAAVMVKALNKGVVSDLNGIFTMTNVPEGEYQMSITYLGYTNENRTVNVLGGTTTTLDITMVPGVTIGNEILVLGDRLKGQAKALNQQKSNMNITNIVAADQIGRFPDANIGDAMKRIPGITIQNDQGEARFGLIRGTAPRLNSVMINGERVPSAEAEVREVQLDLIPSDMVQTIEVNKALTPDMDADAIGGAVNLVTRAAPSGFRVSGTAASGYNFLSDKPIWTGSMIIGNRFLNDKLGVIASASYNNHRFGSDNVEAEWGNEGENEINGEDEEFEVAPYVTELDVRTYQVQRVRRSFSLSLDYKFNANNTIFLRSIYNWRDDWENRYRLRYTDIEPIFADNSQSILGYEGVIERESKAGLGNDRIDNRRLEDQRVWNLSLNGDHLIGGKAKLTWMATYARASEERLNERYITFALDDPIALNHNTTNPEFPFIAPANPAELSFDMFELDELTDETQFTKDEDFNARVDLELPLDIFGNGGTIKFGGRLRSKDKERGNTFAEYSPINGFETLADVTRTDFTNPDYLAGSQYAAGEFASPEFLGGLDLNNPALFEEELKPDEFLAANFNATEVITGGYVMVNQSISPKLSMIAGLRIENTNLEYTGNNVLDEEELQGVITNTDNYTNLLPGLHFKYDATEDLIFRMAWTNTIARPNYYDLVPFRDQRDEDEELIIGNPELRPTLAMNFDLSAENYFKSIGLVSAGVFYKNLDDFIFIERQNDFSDALVNDYDLFVPRNGAEANLMGFELAVQRQLDFLPGIWKGLGIYLNYTYTDSDAIGIRNEDGEERQDDIALPGTTPHMFNASLSFETEKLVLRASMNYADAYIDEVGDNSFTDRYYDEQLFIDLNASYAFTPQWRFFVEVNNLTNQPLRYYQGVSSRTMQVEYYNVRFNAGVKFDIFNRNN